jgi:predicted AlkP superfamily phosphohydrolase/phosphomutase
MGVPMKLFVLGIDGGDKNVLTAFDMPAVKRLFAENTRFDVSEDLFSRGWPEIYTGQHARETGAFYVHPKADGTLSLNKSFSHTDLQANPQVELIWERARRYGHRCGIMNVPTTNPAQVTDGFFVAGSAGGGGQGGVFANFPDALADSEATLDILKRHSYITDVRIVPSTQFPNLGAFFDLLKTMISRRTEAYLELAHKRQVDLGFLAFRALNVVQNIAMSEIQNAKALDSNAKTWVSHWGELLEDFYSHFDAAVGRLFECLAPEHFLIVSDHGAVPYRYRLDASHVLSEGSFQTYEINWTGTAKNLVKKGLPFVTRFRAAQSKKFVSRRLSYDRTIAFFPSWYIPGIYINDRERFGGPVEGGAAQTTIVDDICNLVNANQEAKNHGVSAEPYRFRFSAARFEKYLPDVWLNLPDTMFPFSTDRFVTENPWYGPVPSVNNLPMSIYTGLKGRMPLLYCDAASAKLAEDSRPSDLTLAYRIMDKVLQL